MFWMFIFIAVLVIFVMVTFFAICVAAGRADHALSQMRYREDVYRATWDNLFAQKDE